MNHLPEPHRAIQKGKDNWIWPECDAIKIGGQTVFCAEVFRASGTMFIRAVNIKHLDDYESYRYVPSIYFTAAEWNEF